MIFNISKKGPANRHALKAKFFFKSFFLFFKRKFSDKKSVLAVAYLGGGGRGGGNEGCMGCGRTPLRMFSALFLLIIPLFRLKTITLLKVFYNFIKFLYDLL